MKRIEYLSYPLDMNNPVYGYSSMEIEIKQIKAIARGDSCNTCQFVLQNHWGTHIDFPRHFFLHGKEVINYPADFWLFQFPQVMFLNVQEGQIITKADLPESIHSNTDLLLFHTGWSKYRGLDLYSINNPGLDPEIGLWLRRDFPSIRAVGFDFISVSSYQNRQVGRVAHKAFLDPNGKGNPVLLIEDMYLPEGVNNLVEVWVVPIRIQGLDGAPCTILGVLND